MVKGRKLRNEANLAAQPSEILNLKSQIDGNLPNEANQLARPFRTMRTEVRAPIKNYETNPSGGQKTTGERESWIPLPIFHIRVSCVATDIYARITKRTHALGVPVRSFEFKVQSCPKPTRYSKPETQNGAREITKRSHALGAPVQSFGFEVQSSRNLPNEANRIGEREKRVPGRKGGDFAKRSHALGTPVRSFGFNVQCCAENYETKPTRSRLCHYQTKPLSKRKIRVSSVFHPWLQIFTTKILNEPIASRSSMIRVQGSKLPEAGPKLQTRNSKRRQRNLRNETLRAAGLLPVGFVGSVLTARCGDARTSPPRPQPESLAPFLIFRQTLSAALTSSRGFVNRMPCSSH